VQIIELKMFGGAPNGYPFAALPGTPRVKSSTQRDGINLLRVYVLHQGRLYEFEVRVRNEALQF
jgi:hypothetical protein